MLSEEDASSFAECCASRSVTTVEEDKKNGGTHNVKFKRSLVRLVC